MFPSNTRLFQNVHRRRRWQRRNLERMGMHHNRRRPARGSRRHGDLMKHLANTEPRHKESGCSSHRK